MSEPTNSLTETPVVTFTADRFTKKKCSLVLDDILYQLSDVGVYLNATEN